MSRSDWREARRPTVIGGTSEIVAEQGISEIPSGRLGELGREGSLGLPSREVTRCQGRRTPLRDSVLAGSS
jgi:hypothetical protein